MSWVPKRPSLFTPFPQRPLRLSLFFQINTLQKNNTFSPANKKQDVFIDLCLESESGVVIMKLSVKDRAQ